MYTAKIENSSGQILTLTQNESDFQVISITGLNPPPAQINTTGIAGLDGAKFNSSKLNTRNVVITLKLNGNVEENRLILYQLFRTKESCTFYYSNTSLDVSIGGYVETVECDLFSNSETMQISIICPYPYFKSIDEIIADISNEVAGFSFPFSINIGSPIPFSIYISNRITQVINNSESETGVIIEIDILNPVNKIQIKNTNSGDSLVLQYGFLKGDVVTINTNKGSKSIKLLRNGVTTNIFSSLQQGSVFFQLAVGVNPFGYLVDNGQNDSDVSIKFNYSTIYRGV
jgi:hypothetical protein